MKANSKLQIFFLTLVVLVVTFMVSVHTPLNLYNIIMTIMPKYIDYQYDHYLRADFRHTHQHPVEKTQIS